MTTDGFVTLGRLSSMLPPIDGRRIDRRTLLRLAGEGRFRLSRVGRRYIVPVSEVEILVRQLEGRPGA